MTATHGCFQHVVRYITELIRSCVGGIPAVRRQLVPEGPSHCPVISANAKLFIFFLYKTKSCFGVADIMALIAKSTISSTAQD